MNQELSELALDVREHVQYLQELGVANLAVELAEVPAFEEPVGLARAANDVPRDRLEKFIPEPETLKSVLPRLPEKKEVRASAPRLGLLESTKLSRVVPAEPRAAAPPTISRPTIEMPKSTESKAAEPFGDATAALPSTGETIEAIRADIGDCKGCALCAGRTNIAHSTGSFSAELMFVGEAPGADEDAQGAPFVGRAGQLLTKIIEAIGIKREEVFIGNINRCRPPGNRAPLPDETAACKPFLLREIAVVRPKVIVVLGNTAMKNLLDSREGITKIRGIFQDYYGVKVMPTFHPAYLLRDPSKKREVWDDMKKVRDYLNEHR